MLRWPNNPLGTAACSSAEIASTLLRQRCRGSPSSSLKPPFWPPVPQAQERQALLCSSVLHSSGPCSDRLALAQPSITGQPPPTVGVPGSAAESPGMGLSAAFLAIIATRNGCNLTR